MLEIIGPFLKLPVWKKTYNQNVVTMEMTQSTKPLAVGGVTHITPVEMVTEHCQSAFPLTLWIITFFFYINVTLFM